MEKEIKYFLDMKKQYEAKLWDDQIGFFLLTAMLLLIQLLNSWKVFLICACIEIGLLIVCSKKESKPFGSVLCSFIHGIIWGSIFCVDGWSFIFLMKKPSDYWLIGLAGTGFVALCYCGRLFLTSKRIKSGWYEKRSSKTSFGSQLASAVAVITVAVLRICGRNGEIKNLGHNEICLGLAVAFFVLAIFTSLWIDAGMMYYYYTKIQKRE